MPAPVHRRIGKAQRIQHSGWSPVLPARASGLPTPGIPKSANPLKFRRSEFPHRIGAVNGRGEYRRGESGFGPNRGTGGQQSSAEIRADTGRFSTARRCSRKLGRESWRRGWDSNPRYAKRTTVFETAPFDHSGTSPRPPAPAFACGRRFAGMRRAGARTGARTESAEGRAAALRAQAGAAIRSAGEGVRPCPGVNLRTGPLPEKMLDAGQQEHYTNKPRPGWAAVCARPPGHAARDGEAGVQETGLRRSRATGEDSATNHDIS